MRRTDLTRVEPGIYRTEGGHLVRVKATDPRSGLPVQRTQLVPGGIKAAREAKASLRAEIESLGRPTRQTLSAYAASWLVRKLPGLSVATGERYTVSLDQHVLPVLGRFFVDAITPEMCVTWRDEAAAKTYETTEDGEPVRRQYGPRTVNGWTRVLKSVLGDACAEIQLPSPAARIRQLPEPPAYTDDDPNVLTAEELGSLLVALRERSPAFYPLIATMAYTGLRASEATALKWDDLDRVARAITVRRSHVRSHVRERTKTQRMRRVPVHVDLLAILETHRAALVGAQHVGLEGGWMFPSDEGTPRYGTTLAKPLRQALATAEVTRRLTPHGLRRTLNDLLRLVANTEVQKAITGHSTEAMREHYSHIRLHERASAVAEVVRLVRKV
jgi:integrase